MNSDMDLIAVSPTLEKFQDPQKTADGSDRAVVKLRELNLLWLNTGTLCNLSCDNCYIESTPSNDRLTYLTRSDVQRYLDEISALELPVTEIGITGGEPFMNPDILQILIDCLEAGMKVLVLTNAMRPMMKCADQLLLLNQRFRNQLVLRVSLDHYQPDKHEEERGQRSWNPAIKGLRWLCDNHFQVRVAARTRWESNQDSLRNGFLQLFKQLNLPIDANDSSELILFPEMHDMTEVPEITTECWDVLNVNPSDIMCASSRMVVRRKHAPNAEVVSCTLLPYDSAFSFGPNLKDSLKPVSLNHPHCANFCVLGGGSCSG